jgi:hypothetical protein
MSLYPMIGFRACRISCRSSSGRICMLPKPPRTAMTPAIAGSASAFRSASARRPAGPAT